LCVQAATRTWNSADISIGDLRGGQRRQLEQVGQALAEPRVGGRGDERAAAGAHADVDQPAGLQDPQRLPDRHPADAEALAQVALGGEPVAGPQPALADQLADLVDDDLGHAADADRAEQVRPGGVLGRGGYAARNRLHGGESCTASTRGPGTAPD
jgi:hypothetical protein